MIIYRYNEQTAPPAPFVLTTIATLDGSKQAVNQPAQLDTAADVTAIPAGLVEQLQLVRTGELRVRGFDSEPEDRPTYTVRITLHDFGPIEAEVLGECREPYLLLGRDVLNFFRIVLDGPKRTMEIG